MTHCKFWLVSNSPRRREMLGWMDWDFEASAANIDESRRAGEFPEKYVLRLASEKAGYPISGAVTEDVVIAADTIVVLDGEILGKPADEAQAHAMLSHLRARDHWVMTAIAVRIAGAKQMLQEVCRTRVQMRKYSDREIKQYVKSGDPMDKAGAYAIQNKTFHPVVDFKGCFASVMGMPLCHLERTLQKIPIDEPNGFATICQNHLKYNCSITNRVMAGEDIG